METTIIYWGYNGIMEKKMETTIIYWGYNGIMEKKMETTIIYWGYNGIMEKWKLLIGNKGLYVCINQTLNPKLSYLACRILFTSMV